MSKHCDEEIEDRCDGLIFLLSRQTGEESSFNGGTCGWSSSSNS